MRNVAHSPGKTRTAALVFAALILAGTPPAAGVAAPADQTPTAPFNFVEVTIPDIQNAILKHQMTTTAIVEGYLKRIQAYNGLCVNQPAGVLGPVTMIPNAGQINALMTLNLRPEHRIAWGFDDHHARSMTDPVDNDPRMPDALEVAAQEDAQFAQTNRLVGPLHGVVIALKDQYDTFDMRTTQGADAPFANDRPPADATFVKKLRDAGAIIIAKANMGEYASGDRSSFGGVTCNPYDTERSPGRSSGGSGAAVAANLVTCAIGEESGGSTVNPASLDGVVGLPASVELVSRKGMYAAQQDINDRIGPLCRTVGDVARLLTVIAGYDPLDPVTAFSLGRIPTQPYETFASAKRLDGMRIGVLREHMDPDLFTLADLQSIDRVNQAIEDLRGLGATIVDPGTHGALFQGCVDQLIPELDTKLFAQQWPDLFPVDASGKPVGDQIPTFINLFMDPSLVPHKANGQPDIRSFGPALSVGTGKYKMDLYLRQRGDANIQSTQDLIDKSTFFTDTREQSGFSDKKASLQSTESAMTMDNVNELARRYVIQMITLDCFARLNLDAVVYPTQNIPAPKLGAPTEPTLNDRASLSWNYLPGSANFPIISVPDGFTTEVYDRVLDPNSADGTGTSLVGPTPAALPRGMVILAKPFDEPTLFKIASAYEAATHHRIAPEAFGPLK